MPERDWPAIYSRRLSSIAKGVALWNPDHGYDGSSPARPFPRVRPGDVGFLDDRGSFVRLFNLHLANDHPDQGKELPANFEPIEQNLHKTRAQSFHPECIYSIKHHRYFASSEAKSCVGFNLFWFPHSWEEVFCCCLLQSSSSGRQPVVQC
jgi:hypothetical protein